MPSARSVLRSACGPSVFCVLPVPVLTLCVCGALRCVARRRKAWLSKVGSPKSRIDKADFKADKIDKKTYTDFEITE